MALLFALLWELGCYPHLALESQLTCPAPKDVITLKPEWWGLGLMGPEEIC